MLIKSVVRYFGSGRVGRHFSVLLAEKFIQLLMTLLLSSVLARQLGAEQFGTYNYLLSLLFFATPLYSLGIARILVRELTGCTRPEVLLYSSMWIRLAAGSVLALVGIALFAITHGVDTLWYLLALLLFAHIFYAFDVYQFWFQQKNQHSYLAYYRLSSTIMFTVLKIVLVLSMPKIEVVVIVHALELIFVPLLYRWLFKVKHQNTQGGCSESFDFESLKPVLRQSGYLILSGFAAVLYLRIDIVMLQNMQGPQSSGIYAAAVKLSELWYTVPALLFVVSAPRLIALHQSDKNLYNHRLLQLMSLLFYGAVAFAVVVSCFAGSFIQWIFGPEYQAAAIILIWHVWSGVFVAWREGLSQWLVAERFAEFSLFSHLSGALVNILLNLWLIPDYGALGAAWATVVAYLVSGFLCLWFMQNTRELGRLMLRSVFYPFILFYHRGK